MPAYKLPRSTPEAQGVSSSAILAFVRAVTGQALELHSVMLLRHGRVVAEGWWAPYAAERPHMLFSLSKSFTSSAVGMAVAEGRLTVDDPVLSFFPDEAPAEPDANLQAMRVRHLLTMTTGHDVDATGRTFPQQNWVNAFLSLPVEHAPGTHFCYNTAATYMLSAIVQKLSGMTLLEYLRPRLFAPLGISGAAWESCPAGINRGGTGLSVKTEDIARFGLLYLNRGVWHGRRLLREEWIAAATARQVANGEDAESDWNQGYGYQFWRCRHNCYRGDGAFGQYCLVMPEQDAVLAITAGLGDMQAVLTNVWEHLLPALAPAPAPLPPDPGAEHALTEYLANLHFAPPAGETTSALAARVSGRKIFFPQNDLQASWARFDFAPEHVTFTLRVDRRTHKVACGLGGWQFGRSAILGHRRMKVAAAGTWTAPDTCRLALRCYESPFAMTINCQFSDEGAAIELQQNVKFGANEAVRLSGMFAESRMARMKG